jgi:hypothetical protein
MTSKRARHARMKWCYGKRQLDLEMVRWLHPTAAFARVALDEALNPEPAGTSTISTSRV